MFKLQRFDHMHVHPSDFDHFNEKFQRFMGMDFFMKDDMSEKYGTKVAFEPAPIGVESFQVTDTSKSLSAELADRAQGIYCICFKVDNLKEAIAGMEELGYKMLEYYDNSPILEALFDTQTDFGFNIELTEYPFESMRALAGM